ncbi:MAG TPA: type II toxin-antitoxin system PemK/MazF family toxin [Candidatus Saccharimonadales bacterium]|jgi:mRNA-degrading endonuclease toxin of MazEF toxin-antitoxin module|nr:type II toxin-antitoxin system PemK/MazF family toxin [Candidatus Saccharimonadales bacterium]
MVQHNEEISRRLPLRGEIWFVQIPTDPAGKGPRPVVIVSADGRNKNPRADTVLVAPLTTTIHKEVPTQIYLPSGETGLQEDSCVRAENITVVRKQELREPRSGLRRLSNTRICQIAEGVKVAMAC